MVYDEGGCGRVVYDGAGRVVYDKGMECCCLIKRVEGWCLMRWWNGGV